MDNLSAGIDTSSRFLREDVPALRRCIQRHQAPVRGGGIDRNRVAASVGIGWRNQSESGGGLRRNTHYAGLRILAVDEISIRKGHRCLTVVINYETGRVLYAGKDRKAKTLKRFFNLLNAGQRKAIEAVAMDMWDPYIKAVKKNCRQPKSSSICSTSWRPSTA